MNDFLLESIRKRTRTFTYMHHLRNVITSSLLACSIPSYADFPVTSAQDNITTIKSIDPTIYVASPDRIDTKIYDSPAVPYPLEPQSAPVTTTLNAPAPVKVNIGEAVKGTVANVETETIINENSREGAFTGIDPKIYGAPEVPFPMQQRKAPTLDDFPLPAKVGLGEANKSSTADLATAKAVIIENNRERAGPVDAFKAALTQGLAAKVFHAFTAPDFAPDPDFDPVSAMQLLPFVPTAEQRELLLTKAGQSGEAWNYAVGRMEQQAEAFRTMGDSPISGFIGLMADPGYLILGFILIFGTKVFTPTNKQHT